MRWRSPATGLSGLSAGSLGSAAARLPAAVFAAMRISAGVTGTAEGDGVTVPAGTVVADITSTSPAIEATRRLRDALLAEKVLVKKGKTTSFAKDYTFGSLTLAARVICGTVVNGKAKWKTAG